MQRLEVSGAVRPIYESLGVKRLNLVVRKETARIWKVNWNDIGCSAWMEPEAEYSILVLVMKDFRRQRRYIEINGTAYICIRIVRFTDYVILAALMLSRK